MNERQAKKQNKQTEEKERKMLEERLLELSEKLSEYEKEIGKLQEEEQKNFDDNLMPIDENKMKVIAEQINKISREKNKVLVERNQVIKELAKYASVNSNTITSKKSIKAGENSKNLAAEQSIRLNNNIKENKKDSKGKIKAFNSIAIDEFIEKYKLKSLEQNQIERMIEKFREDLKALQEEEQKNLDENLMPIDSKKSLEIANRIKEIYRDCNIALKIKELMNKDKNTIESNVIEQSVSEDIKEEINSDAPYDEGDEPTQEISLEEIDYESETKMEFDLKNSLYRIYSPYSEAPIIHVVSKELLDPNSDESKAYISELKQKYGSDLKLDGLDLNAAKAFAEFDEKFNTALENRYANDIFSGKIVYDLRKFNLSNKKIVNSDFLNSQEKKQFKKLAKNYKKNHDNCDIVQFSNTKAAKLLGGSLVAGVAATAGVAGISGVTSIISKEDKNNVEYLDGMPIEADENDVIYYDEDGNEITKDNISSETTEIKTPDNTKEEQITTEGGFDGPSDDETIEEDEHKVLRVGDIISAEDMGTVGVYGSSDAVSITEPVNYTDRYFFDGYNVDAISLLDGNTILEVARDNILSIQELIEKYEKGALDLRASFHVKGLDKNNNVINPDVGWIDYYEYEDEYKNKNTMTQ